MIKNIESPGLSTFSAIAEEIIDMLVIGDGNFPERSTNKRCIRCDGHGVPKLLEAILKLFPLDTYQNLHILWKG